jgi:hypothetical protein
MLEGVARPKPICTLLLSQMFLSVEIKYESNPTFRRRDGCAVDSHCFFHHQTVTATSS